jgi:hypothetical protein
MLPQFFLARVATTAKAGQGSLKGETAMETETIQRHCVEAAAHICRRKSETSFDPAIADPEGAFGW